MTNPARVALSRAVNRAIANGAPIVTEMPTPAVLQTRAAALSQAEYIERGRADYEADVKARPFYPDGTRRKSWNELCEIARYSWAKPARLGVTDSNPEFDNLAEKDSANG
jgi:hypothetical protein